MSILVFFICSSLSIWQIKRLKLKEDLINNITEAYNSDSININKLTGDLSNFNFKKVYIEGFFINNKSMFLGPRVHKERVGYNLITPFLLKDERYILINRGWIKEKKIIQDVKNKYEIEGILKEGNIKNFFTPKNSIKNNLWFYINTYQMSEFSGLKLSDNIFLDLIRSKPNDNITIINSSMPKIVNNHLQYALTWAILAVLFLVMKYIYYRKYR